MFGGQQVGSFEIGRTFGRTGSLVASTWRSVSIFLLLIQLLNYGASFAIVAAFGATAGFNNPMAMVSASTIGFAFVYLLSTAAGLAGATSGLLKADRGEAATIGDCFATGAQMCFPVLGLLILWFLGIYLGFILFIVPGCILLAMWCVSVPVLMAEDTGVIGAFGRSRALTKGSRGKIFLVLFLAVIMAYVFAITGVFVFSDVIASSAGSLVVSLAMIILLVLLGILFSLVIQAMLVAIYRELLDQKGERMSSVFD